MTKKVTLTIIIIILLGAGAYYGSKEIINKLNGNYTETNPAKEEKKTSTEGNYVDNVTDIDRMISRAVDGEKPVTLNVKTENNYVIQDGALYITMDKGKSWLKVPEDKDAGYANIRDYLDEIEGSNVYTSSKKTAIIYGGKGSENISIITTESQYNGEAWSVGTISKTANHNLNRTYERMYIDFVDEEKTGYIAIIEKTADGKGGVRAYRSVNTGVTWDTVDKRDELYKDILNHFKLGGLIDDKK
ncbi:MAG: hypothetical protein MR639_06300 [Clostridium sp.]|uniref:hypothetical protein n=1 Tax=Clostridium sp. TaxID=1506 RepID=UPI002A8836DC|nr:hypothetical protein [Clostridium sp.]MDY5099200.1 hypothetical protein [Clostridium sp.]